MNKTKMLTGEKNHFIPDDRGFGEYFFDQADKYSERVFQIDAITGQTETFASIKQRCIRAAIRLKNIGGNPNDVILNCSKNSLDNWAPLIIATFLGAKISNLDPTQSIREWTHCIDIVKPKIVFVEVELVPKMRDATSTLDFEPRFIVLGRSTEFFSLDDLQKPIAGSEFYRPYVIKDNRETVLILFSSGTTGLPKGICHSHYAFINGIKSSSHLYRDSPVFLSFSTLFWISSITFLTAVIEYGGTRIVLPNFDAEEMLQTIEKYEVTSIFTPPIFTYDLTNLRTIRQYDTSSVINYFIGGCSMDPQQLLRMKKLFHKSTVLIRYSCTEAGTCFISCFNPIKDKQFLNNTRSVGTVGNHMEIKIVDSSRGILGADHKGEICCRSPFIMTGYYNMDSSACFDDDGFVRTGDLGYYDANKCLYVVGRMKEMFKFRFWHIAPSYLEAILVEHPDVREAGVFGIPDATNENLPAACVVLEDERLADLNDIIQFYSENVSEWHWLRGGIKIVDRLPKTTNFKLQRNKLFELFNDS